MPIKRGILNFLGMAGFLAILFLVFPLSAQATDFRPTEINTFTTNPVRQVGNFFGFAENFEGGASVAICDLDGNGYEEIVVGAGPGGGPQVRIFDSRGWPKFTPGFFAYEQDFKGGVNVACADLEADGYGEIVTAPKSKGGSQVRIFNRYGQPVFTSGFFAYNEDLKGGLNIAIGDIDGGGLKEIIAAPAYGFEPEVKVFNRYGSLLNFDIYPFHPDFKGGVSLATANVDGGQEDELVMAVQSSDSAWVKVLKFGQLQYLVGDFLAFPESLKSGVNVAGGDIDDDGFDEIIVVAGSGGGPHVKTFEAYGQELPINFFAYELDFRGGVQISSGDVDNDGQDEIITAPGKKIAEGRIDLYKYIEIDISDQRLTYYEARQKLGEFPVSTGKVSMPTPLGEFKIINKVLEAYSRRYTLYMPYWMQFTSMGHGLHGLPFWKLRGGGIIYEGEAHLGIRVSHGCVRLPVPAAAEVYSWAETGTPIIIHM